MESALIGLLGVIVGSLLTTAKDWWLQHYKLRVEARHLCLLIAYALDRYTHEAALVATDEGAENQDGTVETQCTRPNFDPSKVPGDWRCLPASLLNSIFDLQLHGESADDYIDHAFEYDSPPDFTNAFEVRQQQYAELGLKAFALTNELRSYAGVPQRQETNWPVGRMRKVVAKIAIQREQRRIGPVAGDA